MPNPLEPAPPRQIIRNTAWLVAWDETARSHVYRRDVESDDRRGDDTVFWHNVRMPDKRPLTSRQVDPLKS